jgi:REP element-mobilizing transposase RayT
VASQYTNRNYRPYDLIHFTVRGHDRRRIFHSQADHDEFLNELRDRLDAFSSPAKPELLAYGQMSNHQHVFMQAGLEPALAPELIARVSQTYAQSYNWRHGTTGPVFQRPFRGKVIRTPDHIVNTFAYIHLNPDASLRFSNSSHCFYAGLTDDPHIDPTLAWRTFGGREGYLDFFNDSVRIRQARRAARGRLGE